MAISIPNTFANGTTADADEVNDNFTAVSDEVNTYGVWTSVAYVDENFTATGGTWTVQEADQIAFKYTIINKTMFVTLRVVNTVTASLPSRLHVAIPASKTATSYGNAAAFFGGGAFEAMGRAKVDSSATVIDIDTSDLSDFSNESDFRLTFTIAFEIQ